MPAEAFIIEDAAAVEQAYHVLRAKYGWRMTLTDVVSKLFRHYDQRALIRIELAGKKSN